MNSSVDLEYIRTYQLDQTNPVEQFENIEGYVKDRVARHIGLVPHSVHFSNNVLRIRYSISVYEDSQIMFEALIMNQFFKEIKGKFKDIGLNPYELIYILKWLN